MSAEDYNSAEEAATLMPVQELDIDSLPLDQLLQSEWLHQNISQMLNISVDNLTSLLINAHNGGGAVGHDIPIHQQQRDPMPLVAILTTFYAFIFVAGVLGNLITCIVISRNKFMHTATNFYLFNLAVSDLILLLSGMPQDLYNIWYPDSYPFTDVLCVLESVLSETAANATVLTITAFTVERYIAICHPFRQHTMSKLSRAVKFIFAIWIAAFLLALPQAMQFSVVSQGGGTSCTMNNDFFAHVFAVSGFIFFGGPMTAICVLYVLIGLKLKRSRLLQALPRRCYDVNRGISAQSRVIRMLVAVAVTFFLCWAPFHAQRLMAVYGSTSNIDSEVFNEIFRIVDYISGVLYFLSTCINPLLYNIMSHKFREAFKVTLARHFGLNNRYQTQHHNYSALLRQNGSMRLHTTDSIRTTTTSTTMNSAIGGGSGPGSSGGGGNGGGGGGGSSSCRSSTHRNRCGSIGSQATLQTSSSKNDIFNRTTNRPLNGAEHRLLQTQISQLSSVGDANSLLDADLCTHIYGRPVASYRLKELGRTLASKRARQDSLAGRHGAINTSTMAAATKAQPNDDVSLEDAQEWAEHSEEKSSKRSLSIETEFATPRKVLAMPAAGKSRIAKQSKRYLHHSNAEHDDTVIQPSRSRLKLSRIIINRRDQHANKTSENLADKFRWRRKKKQKAHSPHHNNESLAATSSSTPTSPSPPLPITNNDKSKREREALENL